MAIVDKHKKITTTIPQHLWIEARKKGWKWGELLAFAIVNRENMLTEIRELRVGNTKIQTKLTDFSTRIYTLELKVEKLEQEVKTLKEKNT